MTAGIVGPGRDPQVRRVRRALRDRGVEPVCLDLSAFPSGPRLSLTDGVPSVPGVDVGSVTCWYLRSLPLALPFPASGRVAYAAGRESRSLVAGFVSALRDGGAELVNPPEALAQHFRKPEQLALLRAAGVPVPPTLVTNDPDAARRFAAGTPGGTVYKPVAGGGVCRRLDTADDARLPLLSRAPVLFQAEVPGRNVRVFVLDGRVVASYEIVSDRLDYRGAETAVHPVEPSRGERDACRRAAAACGMTFTGIDLRRPGDGPSVLLECNPSPMFAAIEDRTGTRDVTDALAGRLSRAAVPGTSPATASR